MRVSSDATDLWLLVLAVTELGFHRCATLCAAGVCRSVQSHELSVRLPMVLALSPGERLEAVAVLSLGCGVSRTHWHESVSGSSPASFVAGSLPAGPLQRARALSRQAILRRARHDLRVLHGHWPHTNRLIVTCFNKPLMHAAASIEPSAMVDVSEWFSRSAVSEL